MDKVKQLHGGRPPLNDIPGRLRWLADCIERGNIADVKSCIVLLPFEGKYPDTYGFGNVDGEYHAIIQLELAKNWFIKNQVIRR